MAATKFERETLQNVLIRLAQLINQLQGLVKALTWARDTSSPWDTLVHSFKLMICHYILQAYLIRTSDLFKQSVWPCQTLRVLKVDCIVKTAVVSQGAIVYTHAQMYH